MTCCNEVPQHLMTPLKCNEALGMTCSNEGPQHLMTPLKWDQLCMGCSNVDIEISWAWHRFGGNVIGSPTSGRGEESQFPNVPWLWQLLQRSRVKYYPLHIAYCDFLLQLAVQRLHSPERLQPFTLYWLHSFPLWYTTGNNWKPSLWKW